jgi:hypothetical protein
MSVKELGKIEYISSVYGEGVASIAKKFFENSTITLMDRYNRFSLTITNENALWEYISVYYSMSPVRYQFIIN